MCLCNIHCKHKILSIQILFISTCISFLIVYRHFIELLYNIPNAALNHVDFQKFSIIFIYFYLND